MSAATRRYRLYGLVLEGALALECAPAEPDADADVRLLPASARRFADIRKRLPISTRPRQWFECRRLDDDATYLLWDGLFEFLISADGRTIEYHRLAKGTRESLATYLLGQVLSFSLLSRGYEPLHATAVVINGEAVAFLGDCGYGKSTIGAAFVGRGCPVLTDDVLALDFGDGRWMAHAGPPRLKLFPSVAKKTLARSNGRSLNPGTTKLVLPLSDAQASQDAVPLRAFYVLPEPPSRETARPTRIGVTPVEGQAAFLEIVRAAFNLIRVDRARLANQFAIASRLAGEVPMRRLAYPRRLSLLNAVCDAVIADVDTIDAGVRRRARLRC